MRVKDAVGRFGEDVAVRHLEDAGCTVLARNWRCRQGELDIVARDGTALVFVEVKTRSGPAFGTPAQAVDRRKVARVRTLAALWLAEARTDPDNPANRPAGVVRFDVVAVVRHRSGGVEVEHLRGAF